MATSFQQAKMLKKWKCLLKCNKEQHTEWNCFLDCLCSLTKQRCGDSTLCHQTALCLISKQTGEQTQHATPHSATRGSRRTILLHTWRWTVAKCVTFCAISPKVLAITCLWALLRLVRILTTGSASEPVEAEVSTAGKKGSPRMRMQLSTSTFLLQRWLELQGIPFWVEVGKGPNCSKGTPGHVLWKSKLSRIRVTRDSGPSIKADFCAFARRRESLLAVAELRVSQICATPVEGWVRTDEREWWCHQQEVSDSSSREYLMHTYVSIFCTFWHVWTVGFELRWNFGMLIPELWPFVCYGFFFTGILL